MDHTSVGLRAVVRSLTDVVTPAIDPGASLAMEQLRLSIDYIEFVMGRIDYLHARDQFELRHHLEMARNVQMIVASVAMEEVATLVTSIERGVAVSADSSASAQQMKLASSQLASAISRVVKKAPELEDTARFAIERSVVRSGQAQIAFERSWYLPLGFDPDPANVRPLSEVISA